MIRARSGKTAGRLVLGAGVLAVLIPAIAGCEAGADAPTLQFHQAAAGAYGTANEIQASNAFVVGAPTGGTLPAGSSVGLFVSLYNGGDSADTLLSATAQNGKVALSNGPVSIPANSTAANLTGPTPELVVSDLTKPVDSGGTIQVVLNFQHAGQMTLQVPVMARAYYYSTFSPPAPSGSGSVSPGGAATAPALGGSASATPGGSATPTATP